MGFNDNDFVLIEYSVRVKDTGNLLDTTSEELAKKENVYDPEKLYGPTLIVIGRGWINPVVESEIRSMSVGEERVVEVPPEKAYGVRDPDKVKVFRLADFKRRGIDVRVGEVIDFGGVQGVVKSISGGRVVVDFNHPLAGKTLVYTIRVVAKLEDLVDKIRALAAKHMGIRSEELGITVNREEREVVVDIPSKYITKRNLQYAKVTLATDIFSIFKNEVSRVVYREVISLEKPEEKPKTSEMGAEQRSEATTTSSEQAGSS